MYPVNLKLSKNFIANDICYSNVKIFNSISLSLDDLMSGKPKQKKKEQILRNSSPII